MIEAAAIVSAVLGRWEDFAIITTLLLFNTALEFWQDLKASNALAALRAHARSAWPARRTAAPAGRCSTTCRS